MKIWNGTEFVDSAGYKVWNGTAFVDPKEIHIWDGSAFKKIWPSGFAKQRINKVGNYSSGSNYDLKQVTGWASDPTYPATIVGDKMVLSGGGLGNISAFLDSQTDDSAVSGAVKLMLNNDIIATGDLTNYQSRAMLVIDVPNVTLASGDTIWLQTQTGSAIYAKIYADSYIQVSSVSSILRQKASFSGHSLTTNASTQNMKGWISDSTYPSNVEDTGIAVVGTNTVNINASIEFAGNTSGWQYVTKNGVDIAQFGSSSGFHTSATGTLSNVPVSESDVIGMRMAKSNTGTTTANGSLELVPTT